jgi:hypothetical protein
VARPINKNSVYGRAFELFELNGRVGKHWKKTDKEITWLLQQEFPGKRVAIRELRSCYKRRKGVQSHAYDEKGEVRGRGRPNIINRRKHFGPKKVTIKDDITE